LKLYFSPGSCSLASRIALLETGMNAEYVSVDLRTKLDQTGADYTKVNPKGYVPALMLPNGQTMTEGVAILQWVADQNTAKNLLPAWGTAERYKAIEWFNYVATEVHKSYSPLFRPGLSDEQKANQVGVIQKRLQLLETQVGTAGYVLGKDYSFVDTYLFVILSWSPRVGVDLEKFPNLRGFMERVRSRPAVAQALAAEFPKA
jgi:glutathione S-transferase